MVVTLTSLCLHYICMCILVYDRVELEGILWKQGEFFPKPLVSSRALSYHHMFHRGTYRHSASPERVAALSIETKSIQTFRFFLPEQKWSLWEKNNSGTTRIKWLQEEFLQGEWTYVHVLFCKTLQHSPPASQCVLVPASPTGSVPSKLHACAAMYK